MTRGAGRTCPSCGTLNKPTWEFCARCGDQLEAAAGAARAAMPAAASPEVYDDDFGFPWRQAFLLLLAAAVVAGSIAIRRAGPPATGAFLTIPTLPPPDVTSTPEPISPARATLVEGRRQLASGDITSALDSLARAAGEMPEDAAAQHAYARALWEAGRKDEALAQLKRAAGLAPDAQYQVELARTLNDMGQTADARQVLEQAAARTPDDPRVLQDLGQMYVNSGSSERAVPLLRRAMELRGDDPKLMAQLGVALEKTGARGEAITAFQGALDKLPNSQMARTLLADALSKDGRKDEAMQVVQAGLTATPQSSMLHKTLGLVLERSGKPGDAAQAYRDYLRLAPNAPDAQELAARAARLEKRAGTTSS